MCYIFLLEYLISGTVQFETAPITQVNTNEFSDQDLKSLENTVYNQSVYDYE